jgi:predicted nuclease of predicted toxin-antitoxin system
MKVSIDENVVRQVAEGLGPEGHEVQRIKEIARGSHDDGVLSLANQRDALLLTGDKDFGELVFRQHQRTLGVILIRLDGLPHEEKAEIVRRVFQEKGTTLLHAFTVITRRGVRVRQTPA